MDVIQSDRNLITILHQQPIVFARESVIKTHIFNSILVCCGLARISLRSRFVCNLEDLADGLVNGWGDFREIFEM